MVVKHHRVLKPVGSTARGDLACGKGRFKSKIWLCFYLDGNNGFVK